MIKARKQPVRQLTGQSHWFRACAI